MKQEKKFIQVKCEKCKNEQVIFSRASSTVNCLVCSEILATPTGGKSVVNAKILEYFG